MESMRNTRPLSAGVKFSREPSRAEPSRAVGWSAEKVIIIEDLRGWGWTVGTGLFTWSGAQWGQWACFLSSSFSFLVFSVSSCGPNLLPTPQSCKALVWSFDPHSSSSFIIHAYQIYLILKIIKCNIQTICLLNYLLFRAWYVINYSIIHESECL